MNTSSPCDMTAYFFNIICIAVVLRVQSHGVVLREPENKLKARAAAHAVCVSAQRQYHSDVKDTARQARHETQKQTHPFR